MSRSQSETLSLERLLATPGMTSTAKLVACVLTRMARGQSSVAVENQAIANALGKTVRRVQEALVELEGKGFVARSPGVVRNSDRAIRLRWMGE